MRSYVSERLESYLDLSFSCLFCHTLISDDALSDLVDPLVYDRIHYLKRTAAALPNENKKITCTNCHQSFIAKLTSSKSFTICNSCFMFHCGGCHRLMHPYATCAGALEADYTEQAAGKKDYQMCTRCDRVLKRDPSCNHFTCNECQVSFCMHCRGKFTDGHMNPFSEKPCPVLFKLEIRAQKINESMN